MPQPLLPARSGNPSHLDSDDREASVHEAAGRLHGERSGPHRPAQGRTPLQVLIGSRKMGPR